MKSAVIRFSSMQVRATACGWRWLPKACRQRAGRAMNCLIRLSGFGTTSQMFDAAYWRAKEGELARTILADARGQGCARPYFASANRGVSP